METPTTIKPLVEANKPPFLVGYAKWEKGEEVIVQDLRVRFGFRKPGTQRLGGDTLIFRDRSGVLQGFIVDKVVDFCSLGREQSTPWGIDVELGDVPYKPYVEGRSVASGDQKSLSYLRLRLDYLFRLNSGPVT